MMWRLPRCCAEFGCGRSTIYLRIADGLLPELVRLGANSSGLPEEEGIVLRAAIVGGLPPDEQRTLVKRLMAKRRAALEEALR